MNSLDALGRPRLLVAGSAWRGLTWTLPELLARAFILFLGAEARVRTMTVIPKSGDRLVVTCEYNEDDVVGVMFAVLLTRELVVDVLRATEDDS